MEQLYLLFAGNWSNLNSIEKENISKHVINFIDVLLHMKFLVIPFASEFRIFLQQTI